MKLALFDLDGTLYNTNDVNYYAYKEALNKYDVDIDYNYYCDYCNGRHYTVFVPPLVNNDKDKIEDIHKTKKEAYSKYLDKVKVNEHLFNIIESIKNEYTEPYYKKLLNYDLEKVEVSALNQVVIQAPTQSSVIQGTQAINTALFNLSVNY